MQNMDYYQISAEELGKNSKIPILKLSDSGEVFYELALEMKETIEDEYELDDFETTGRVWSATRQFHEIGSWM